MPVHDQDEREPSPPSSNAAGDTPGAGDGQAPTPGARRRWRRVVNRRNAMWTAIVAAVAVVALVVIVFILYRSGQVDRIITNQIVSTLAEYNIRAEVGGFRAELGPRTAAITDLKLYDASTGAPLGRVGRLVATIRVTDLYALSLRRNVNLESLIIDDLEAWVTFDAEGRSNFSNIRLPEPNPNRRILFSYSTATVRLNNAVIHYDDRRHELSGEARNLRALVQPDDPAAPAESRMNRVELAFSNSTFVYDGRPVNDISVEARARVDQRRAEIQEVILRSPVAGARLTGTLDDWRNLRYQTRATANVDLTQLSDVLRAETTLRGAGRFEGTVSGEGDRYRVEGEIVSDALAADGVRLKALNVNLRGEGQGKAYEAQGRAVAELLTAGDFQLNSVQVAGGVMGTGTDFRWVGDLRAAALRSGTTTVAGLVLSDAAAELKGGGLSGGAKRVAAGGLVAAGAGRGGATTVSGLEASGVSFKRDEGGAASATIDGARVARVQASGATVNSVAASGVRAEVAGDGAANVSVERVQVGGLVAAGARTGSLNVAGVRLAVSSGGRVEGRTDDIDAGTVAFRAGGAGEGSARNVRLARPVFVLEPGGRYRASADLSLGGGVLGTMPLGAARAAVVATNDAVQLNNFNAEIFNGRASGSATVATSRRAQSRVAAEFAGVDVGNLIAVFSNNVVPVAGAATGTVDLRFPGTDFEAASGTLNASFAGETGDEARGGRTPLNGEVALRADRGLFQVERANLRTAATELNASGRFSFRGDSDLRVNLASTDASELQRVLAASGLAGEAVEQLNRYKVGLAGNLAFNGTLTGALDDPLVNGRFSLDSLQVNGRDLGALSASVASNASEVRVTEGRLAERDGGSATFTVAIPRVGTNNIAVEAALEQADAGNLVAALAGGAGGDNAQGGSLNPSALAGLGPASGRLSVTGLPGAMSGSANLTVGPGTLGGEPFEQLTARAAFNGSEVNLEELAARFRSGFVTARGSYNLDSKVFDLQARGQDVQLQAIAAVAGGGRAPNLSGLANFTASARGDADDPRSFRVEIDARGRDVSVNGRPAGELTLVGTTTADQKFNLQLTTGLLGAPQVVRAQIDLADEDLPATVETNFAATDLTPLFATLLPAGDVRVTGRVTGRVFVKTTVFGDEGLLGDQGLGALRGTAEFSELVINVNDTPIMAENPLLVEFTPNQITFTRTRFTGPDTNILFGGTTALREGGRQDLTVDGQLNLRVLNKLSPNIVTSGVARVGVRVAGTFAEPRVTGTAEVERASFTAFVADESLNFNNITGRIRFNADRAEIDSLEGRLGGGRVRIVGGAALAGLRPSQFRFGVRAENVTVPFPDRFRSTADARIELRGTSETQLLEGTVNLRRTEFTEDIDLADLIEERRAADITEAGGGGGGAGGFLTNLQLALQVQGRDALVVRNNLADAVGSVSLLVRGSAEDPVISGRVTASRGTLNFRNNRFELTRAFIDLPPRRGVDPILNIQAESEIRGYRVIAGITGPLAQPVTSLRSDPALPQVDVVSLILTGNLSDGGAGGTGQSTLAQTGLGTATSILTESLVSSPVRRATDKLFGLNRLEIDPLIAGRGGASPTARLTIGRQISRNLSVTYSTNVTTDQNQVLAVEYRVSDRLSFVAQYQQGAVNTLRPQQDNFNFEIRFRKRF